MTERGENSAEVEKLREFWEGHDFNDNCPVREYPHQGSFMEDIGCLLVIPSLIGVVVEGRVEERQLNRVYDQLRAYLAIKQGTPIKTLAKGDTFNLSQYPSGTIVHISSDSQSPDSVISEPYSHKDWGIITQNKSGGKQQDVLCSFTERQLERGRKNSMAGRRWVPDTNVGEVRHIKDKQKRPFPAYQYLNRLNSVEIWKFGQEVREREKVAVSLLSRVFRPSDQR